MAFSENQNQLKKHGDAVLGDELRRAKTPVRSIALWNRVNQAAADYGEEVRPSRAPRCVLPTRWAGGSSARSA
jgi:hypothetical protein